MPRHQTVQEPWQEVLPRYLRLFTLGTITFVASIALVSFLLGSVLDPFGPGHAATGSSSSSSSSVKSTVRTKSAASSYLSVRPRIPADSDARTIPSFYRDDYKTLISSGWTSSGPKLADGCQHVYLDMGSNVGVQTRKLYRPEMFPGAYALPVYDEYFPNVTERRETVCSIGIEPNPKHYERLRRLARIYTGVGWRTSFLEAAASNTEGTAGFEAPVQNEYQPAAKITSSINATQVPTINISNFIITQILSRHVPHEEQPHFVIAKMDIEGMEFEVIPMMIRTGAACGINAIMLEWHGRSRIELKCTRWIEMDDEKYFTVADEKDKITIRKPLPLPRPRPRPQPSPIPLPPMRPLPTSAATAAFNNATRTNEPGYGPGSVQLAR